MSEKKAMATKKAAKGKKKPQASGISVAAHPRAQRSINMAKSYAGLGAFAFAGYVSWHAGMMFLDVAGRALMWGMASYVLVWALSVQIWRHVAIAEVRAAENRLKAAREPDPDQVAKLTKVLEDNGMPTSGTGVPVP
jgi:hypothetical protein